MAEPAGHLPVVADENRTVRITLRGRVQGVGFRPFVYRLARQAGLTGTVQNRLGEVEIVASGRASALARFERKLIQAAPPLSKPRIDRILPVAESTPPRFEIVRSSELSSAQIFVPPDYFMCDDCRNELADPADRRFRYPFINCTQCGPRYTLIEALPYDRQHTSMAEFALCPDCEKEYLDPADRRFHAEPVACPRCGPQLSLRGRNGSVVARRDAALRAATGSLRHGGVVAVKGIGGYHLLCDARNAHAVATLRLRKQRPAKPLAVMFPLAGGDGLFRVHNSVALTTAEADALRDPVRPIVLARKRSGADLAANVAPGLDEIGVLLPYSPLHQLLLEDFGGPLVATSGNVSGEPVITDNDEACARLHVFADEILEHDRPIVRPADDPVCREVAGRIRPIRTGRGSAPAELELPWRQPQPLLAVGGHMKGTVALSWDKRVVVSPHIGEMDSPRSLAVFEQVARDLQHLYGVRAATIACDAHPAYATHRWANEQTECPVEPVWHHRAHASALAAEYEPGGRWLVFTWDGVGYGEDGTLWGGEALLGKPGAWRRVCSLRPFRLPGGDRAGREPWRSAAALMWETGQAWPGCPDTSGVAFHAWQRDLNCPTSSAAGRLFDAAAALIRGVMRVSYEAEGPMLLEAMCNGEGEVVDLPLREETGGLIRSDWQPLLERISDKRVRSSRRAEIFHATMAGVVLAQARRIRDTHGFDRVGLCGGVFQNRRLTERACAMLRDHGMEVRLGRRLPCNDAALSFGQAAELAALAGAD